jgi:hypothetical protein
MTDPLQQWAAETLASGERATKAAFAEKVLATITRARDLQRAAEQANVDPVLVAAILIADALERSR